MELFTALASVALPELFLAGWAMLLLIVGASLPAHRTAVVQVLALVGLAFSLLIQQHTQLPSQAILLFKPDAFSQFCNIVLTVLTGLAMLSAADYWERHKRHLPEFYVLLTLALLGVRLMLAADDFLLLYIGLEMLSFSVYILAAFLRDNAKSAESALKYFALGALASGIFLYGISLLYGIAGSTHFGVITQATAMATTQPNMALAAALVMVVVGLLFKVSAMPFHMWTPDVYEGAPTPVTALMAGMAKLAAVALTLRVLDGVFGHTFTLLQWPLEILAAVTMIGGALMAIIQNNIKRLLAYSSISQAGFLLMGVVAGTAEGVASVLFYLTIYGLTVAGLFAVILQLRQQNIYAETLQDIKGLAKDAPMTALVMLVCLFSLSGVPPMAGFFAKFYVFKAALQAGMVELV
ncbi:MAG: NADH-quinone oxidoreductase subunit N, partial [Alphaproteobacteria bacterium]